VRVRGEIEELAESVIRRCEDMEDGFIPNIKYDYQTLKGQIKAEKEENDLLYREMMSLKRENNTSQKRIQVIAASIARLEKALGVKPKK
jgi:predicted nuclease with TOPRIM domain